jgi:PAS domain S-box-containing protein
VSDKSKDIDYEGLFNAMPLPRFLLKADGGENYKLVRVNSKASHYFDLGDVQQESLSIDRLFDEDNAKLLYDSLKLAKEQKKTVSFDALPGLPGKMSVGSFSISPLVEEDGDTPCFYDVVALPAHTGEDEALQRERDDAISLLTSVFDVSEVGIIVTDHNGRIVRVNESFLRIYGWSRDEIIGNEFVNLIVPEERDLARNRHSEFLKSGIRGSGEMKLLRKDQSIANALYTTAALELSQGRRFQVTTVMDITLRKQMEMTLRLAKEQADAANKAKSTFLANMSHELRTPLNAIIGFSELMMKETFGPVGSEKYKEYQSDIVLSARHLLDVINEVLDMSKIEAGRVELQEERFEIKDVIHAVMRMMASRAFSGGLKLEDLVQEDLPAIYADPRLVKQVLINLLGNAVKYTKSGGKVELHAYVSEKGDVVIEVKDNGVGIPKDKIAEALEPFSQISQPIDEGRYKGTGLGLPLAKTMTELHGGHLEIESEENIGTTVRVILPGYRTNPDLDKGDKSPLSRYKLRGESARLVEEQRASGVAQGAE